MNRRLINTCLAATYTVAFSILLLDLYVWR